MHHPRRQALACCSRATYEKRFSLMGMFFRAPLQYFCYPFFFIHVKLLTLMSSTRSLGAVQLPRSPVLSPSSWYRHSTPITNGNKVTLHSFFISQLTCTSLITSSKEIMFSLTLARMWRTWSDSRDWSGTDMSPVDNSCLCMCSLCMHYFSLGQSHRPWTSLI